MTYSVGCHSPRAGCIAAVIVEMKSGDQKKVGYRMKAAWRQGNGKGSPWFTVSVLHGVIQKDSRLG